MKTIKSFMSDVKSSIIRIPQNLKKLITGFKRLSDSNRILEYHHTNINK